MDLGTAIIISSLISMLGFFIWSERNNINWYKKMNFKQGIKVENLKIAKIKKDLDLKYRDEKEDKGLIESIKDLDADKIKNVLSMLQGDDEEDLGDEGEPITDIINQALKNPDLIKQFLGKKDKETDENKYI